MSHSLFLDLYNHSLESFYTKAQEIALDSIELMAKHILKNDTMLDEFIMNKGNYKFTYKGGGNSVGLILFDDRVNHSFFKNGMLHAEYSEKYQSLIDFIEKWEKPLQLNKVQMRCGSIGEPITQW